MKLLGVAQVKLLTHTHAYITSYAHTCKHNTYVPRERTIEGEKNREKGERETECERKRESEGRMFTHRHTPYT